MARKIKKRWVILCAMAAFIATGFLYYGLHLNWLPFENTFHTRLEQARAEGKKELPLTELTDFEWDYACPGLYFFSEMPESYEAKPSLSLNGEPSVDNPFRQDLSAYQHLSSSTALIKQSEELLKQAEKQGMRDWPLYNSSARLPSLFRSFAFINFISMKEKTIRTVDLGRFKMGGEDNRCFNNTARVSF
ncbi:hypothetical protein GC177_08935 [bacterium]|nr:hypothetical protein [bacterium]